MISAAAPAGGQPKSAWAGVYTEAQAIDGETVYTTHCASCHGPDLGGIEQAPALAGAVFGEKWNGATLKKLFDRIESMPPTKPNSLSGRQYVDALAYLLSASELPPGSAALEADRGALAEIVFTRVRPQH